MKYPIRYKDKYVGQVEGNVFYTKRDNKGFFRKFKSINISKEVICKIKNIGAEIVEFHVTIENSDEKFRIHIDEIEKHETYPDDDDLQWILPIAKLRSESQKTKIITMDNWCEKNKRGMV